ncbi:MAG: ribbon-helix-helix protein, CopG family [Pseudomonadota bacterium]
MRKRLTSTGVCLPYETLNLLDAWANKKGTSRSEAIRRAVEAGISLLDAGVNLNLLRLVTITEHTQLALSLMTQKAYPDLSDKLLRDALQNVKDFHSPQP